MAPVTRRKDIDRGRAPERSKTSLSLTPDAKYKLTTLKAALRLAGFTATESSIIETLLETTDEGDLIKRLKRVKA
jgi:hypothetical protein